MLTVQAIPYKNFKEKIRIIKQYEKTCYVKDLGNIIYILEDDKRGKKNMEIRCSKCRKLLGEVERAEDFAIAIKCTKCKLKKIYSIENI